MRKISAYIAILIVPFISLVATALAYRQAPPYAGSFLALDAGDACRKDICDAAVEACMRTDLWINPLASTEAKKRGAVSNFSLAA
jgi:hypothetical protein